MIGRHPLGAICSRLIHQLRAGAGTIPSAFAPPLSGAVLLRRLAHQPAEDAAHLLPERLAVAVAVVELARANSVPKPKTEERNAITITPKAT